MSQPQQDFGAVAWESARTVHAKCMDCRWMRVKGETSDAAKRHVRTTGHSIIAASLVTYLVVPEAGRG